ncbi:MAG: cell division protein FtsW [Synergistaceae bacterium]|nr:cell division protein FtsW [Synergistaceae bacterium]
MEIIIPLILNGFSMVMISSLSLRNNMMNGNPYAQPLKQFQFIGIGVILAMMMMTYCESRREDNAKKKKPGKNFLDIIRDNSGKLFAFSWFLVVLTLIPGLGVKVGGARRWLSLPGFRFQPLEVILFTLPIFMADRLTDESSLPKVMNFKSFLKPTLTVIIIVGTFLMGQPNLGGTILVAAICLTMHVERRGWKYPLITFLIAAVLAVGFINFAPYLIAEYRMRRVRAFLDPWEDPMNTGYQIIQGLVAFANGSLTGVGIGKGLQQEKYLPEASTDYIFPAIGEEFGLVGTMFLLILYALWTWKVFYIYKNAKSPFTKSLALGLAASVIYPMFVNAAGVMKLMPLTGIPMPFVSAGGSSMLFMWAKVGLLICIKIESEEYKDDDE